MEAVGALWTMLATPAFFLCFLGVWLILKRILVGAHHELSNRICSLLHAITVATLGAVTVLTDDDNLGVTSLQLSIGYFAYDTLVVLVNGSPTTFYAVLAHHICCAFGLAYVIHAVPDGIFYACLIQCSESTIPVQFGVYLLEKRGAQHSQLYRLARWLQLAMWLSARIGLFLVYFFVLWKHWLPQRDLPAKVLCLVMGPALLLFNIGGLVTVVLPGFPWPRGQVAKKEKQR